MSDMILSRIGKPVSENSLPKYRKISERTFGRWRIVVEEEKLGPVAKFYDTYQNPVSFPGGQFVSSYYVETLLGKDRWSDGSIAEYEAFNLDTGCREWTVCQPELTQIAEWLESLEQ